MRLSWTKKLDKCKKHDTQNENTEKTPGIKKAYRFEEMVLCKDSDQYSTENG